MSPGALSAGARRERPCGMTAGTTSGHGSRKRHDENASIVGENESSSSRPGAVNDPERSCLKRTVARARSGDETAFRELVRRVHDRIHRWSISFVRDTDLADEVTQRVLIRLHRHLHTYDGSSAFRSWLYGITRNTAFTVLRSEHSANEVALQDDHAQGDAPSPIDRMEDRRFAELVGVFFDDLSPRQREVFDLVDLQGQSPSEAAEMCDLSPSTVRVHLHRARRRLRTAILKHRPDLKERFDNEV